MKRVFTIPNILSVFRILLIPIFIYFYFADSIEQHLLFAVAVLVISGLTDVLDGFIARRYHMVSNVGKILDPAADKLTQATVVICLAWARTILFPLLVVFFLKEILMLLGSLLLFNKGKRPTEAKWFGKLSTAVLYIVMIMIILSDIFHLLPEWVIITLVVLTCACIIFSLINYYPIFKEIMVKDTLLNNNDTQKDKNL